MEGEPADSDWSRWASHPENIADRSSPAKATEFWKDPEKDFSLAQELGANMFRLSIAWERVEPSPGTWNEAALDRYESMLVSLRRRGIEPLVTLQHFVLPEWLAEKGGLTAPDFDEEFTKYALKVVRRLALGPAHVHWWMTFNEPMVLVFGGYLTGEWPPNKRNPFAASRAEAGIVRAHLKALNAIRGAEDLPADLHFSVAEHWRDFQAQGFGPLNAPIASWADWIFNRQLLNSLQSGNLYVWIPGAWPIREKIGLPTKGSPIDYLGINYYGRNVFSWHWKPPFFRMDQGDGVKNDLGWVVYPEGLAHVLSNSYSAYKLPILISENGVADASDSLRSSFLKEHIARIKEALKRHIPVIGYLHWSLTDNFEWAEGIRARFGLVRMDYESGKRFPRPSFWVYQKLIKEGIHSSSLTRATQKESSP